MRPISNGLRWLRRFFWTSLNRLLLASRGVSLGRKPAMLGLLSIRNRGTINIGRDFESLSGWRFNPIGGDIAVKLVTLGKEAVIKIGDNVGISNSIIVCSSAVMIGNNVLIGAGVKLLDTNFHSIDPDQRANRRLTPEQVKSLPIIIEDNVFIGTMSIVLKGVTLGEGCIIAAGSVVSKSIPPHAVAGGNPCKVIKFRR